MKDLIKDTRLNRVVGKETTHEEEKGWHSTESEPNNLLILSQVIYHCATATAQVILTQ